MRSAPNACLVGCIQPQGSSYNSSSSICTAAFKWSTPFCVFPDLYSSSPRTICSATFKTSAQELLNTFLSSCTSFFAVRNKSFSVFAADNLPRLAKAIAREYLNIAFVKLYNSKSSGNFSNSISFHRPNLINTCRFIGINASNNSGICLTTFSGRVSLSAAAAESAGVG